MKEAAKGRQLDVSIEDIRSSWKVPAIAHFCSLFRSTFSLPDFEIEELEEALFLDAGVEESDFIVNLVVQLLRGIHGIKSMRSEDHLEYLRSVMKEQWELGEKRVNPLNSQDVTFKMLPTLTKVEILHALCDYRLDAADVTVLKDYDGDNLRVEPLGTDRAGATYWYFYGTRLYKEDRQLTQEERNAKHKQKLKEKRRQKKDRLKAIKSMKEARRKHKQKIKKGKSKGSGRDKKKKKKSSKLSDDEGSHELVTVQRLQNLTDSSNVKKGQRRKTSNSEITSAPSSKLQKNTKSKQRLNNNNTPNQNGMKNVDKSKKSGAKKQSLKKAENEKKHKITTSKKSSTNKRERAIPSKCKSSKTEIQQSAKRAAKSHNDTKASTSKKGRNKANETRSLQAGPGKSRKRKVIKSKAIISESEEDSDDEQPLTKIAKVQRSHMDVQKFKANQKKSSKSRSACKYQTVMKTKPKKAASSESKDHIKQDQIHAQTNKTVPKTNRLPTTCNKVCEMTTWSSEEDVSSSASVPQSSDTDTDSEDDMEPPRWHLVCHSQEDWQQLTDFFKKSKVQCEKELYKTLANDFLPEIHSLFAAKEKALRKKLQELAPRRASSRVVIMQLKREEEERLKSIEEAEQSSRRQQIEEEKREKMKLRNKLQQHPNQHEHVDGDKSLKTSQSSVHKKQTDSKKVKKVNASSESIHAPLQQVYDAVSKHEDSWPFLDPVDEAYAPAYYQIVIKPMCLGFIQEKLKKGDYKTKDEFERDMNQLFTNCLEYNGPGNEYTLMAENLKSCLEYNMDKIFPKEEVDSDGIDSDGSSSVLDHYVHQRPPQRQSARNANTRLEKMDDKVYARLRGLSSSESSIVESQDSSRVASDEEDDTDVNKIKEETVKSEHQVKLEQHEDRQDHGNDEGNQNDIKVSSLTDTDDVPTINSHMKQETSILSTCTINYSENDDQTNKLNADKSPTCTTSRKDYQNDASAFKPRGVIAFAPCLLSKEQAVDDIPVKDIHQQQTQPCNDDKKEFEQCGKDVLGAVTTELGCKENQGQMSNAPLQASSTSKANRVKPVQNVRPYVPDSHSEDGNAMQSLPRDQHRATLTSQGPPAMIDLNSRRLDVLNPMTSSPSERDIPFHSENSFGLNQAVPRGNLFVPSSQNQGFQHSKQSAHSGTKSHPQITNIKSENLPDLPAPLTVLPIQETAVHHVPAVQPLLPSSNSFQASHWNEQQSTNITSNPFQYSGHFPPPSSQSSRGTNVSELTQKLWHPLGFEDKSASGYPAADKSALYMHTMANHNEMHPDHKKLSQEGTTKAAQSNSQSRNILESLLHGKSNICTSENQQSNYASKNLYMLSMSSKKNARQDNPDFIAKDDSIASIDMRQFNLSSSGNVHYRDAPGHCHTDKKEQPNRSRQPMSNHSPAHLGLRYVPPVYCSSLQGSVQLPNQTVEAAASNSSQSVIRQPENVMQGAETSIARQQKVASIPQYPHSSSDQSNVAGRADHGKDNMSQVQMRHADKGGGIGTMMPVGKSESFLSMLTTDSRSMKGYKDHFAARGYAGPRPAYNQAHSSLYTDHPVHAGQASVVSHGYPSGSHLNHLLPTRQKSDGQTSSAFTPHPYSSHSVFRMQRPSHALFPQYIGQQEAEQFARQQYQQHMHHRAGVGTGLTAYRPQPSHTYPDMAYYTQHGVGSPLLGNQPVGGVGAPVPFDPTLLSHPSHMQGYK
ncbi:LOW QUALITY PROTEIN: uncharacterized protein LOC119723070 [Patiria miniata]|uniref:Bromo domain-containing protein n=1 Tax=Patiria miniata TaxID=46514 RepID=A0A913ZEM0_PATMI|nr:LOW QUALITY PROTEIN: uncharacterized protein LOC119723070 [Patiria miniata]